MNNEKSASIVNHHTTPSVTNHINETSIVTRVSRAQDSKNNSEQRRPSTQLNLDEQKNEKDNPYIQRRFTPNGIKNHRLKRRIQRDQEQIDTIVKNPDFIDFSIPVSTLPKL